MQNILERYWERVPRKARGWFREFIKSEKFKELTDEQKMHSENVIMTFAETVYHFEFQTPQEWDEHGVLCCCPGIFSTRPINDKGFIKAVPPVLTQFFEFLYEKGYKEDGQRLAGIMRKLEPEVLRSWDKNRNSFEQELG